MAKLKADKTELSEAEVTPTTQSETPEISETVETSKAESDGADSTTSAAVTDPAPKPTTQEKAPSKTEAKKPKKEEPIEPDSRTLAILETFKNYETLYVDRSGSVYAPGTPERIRGSAKLYTNPYFKTE